MTAKFGADFSSFTDAVSKADVELRDFETGAGKVQASINRIGNSLSGTKLIQDASLMAKAVEDIGGVSALTEKELGRVAAQAQEAANKLRAMGQDVPPGIQKIADAAKNVGTDLSSLKGVLASTASAFGLAFSVGAVVQFGKSVFESASQIHDIAEKLDISTDAAQGFGFAATQAGSSLDAVGIVLNKMNANLAGGDKSTVQALKDAGLSFGEIRAMKPEDAFLAITDAIQKIPDPMVQADVALKLFGKSSSELLPAIKEGFRGAADAAHKMSAQTIIDLEAAQDAWTELGRNVTIVSGNLIAATMTLGKSVTSSAGSLATFAKNVLLFGAGPAANMAVAFDAATNAGQRFKDVNLSLPGPLKKTAEQLAAEAAAAKKAADEFNAMFAKFSGTAATDQLKVLDAVFRKLASSGQLTENEIAAITKEAVSLWEAGGKLTPRLLDMVIATGQMGPGLNKAALNMQDFGAKVFETVPAMAALSEAMNKLDPDPKVVGISNLVSQFAALKGISLADMKKEVAELTPATKDWSKALSDVSRAFQEVASISSGSLGVVLQGIGRAVSAMGSLKDAAEAYGKIANKTFSDTASLAASSVTGIIPIFSTLVSIFDNWGAAEERQRKIADASMREQFDSALALAGSLTELKKRVDALGFSWSTLSAEFTRSRGDIAATGVAIDRVGTSITDFNKQFADTPQGMAEASYKTQAELQQIADKAKATYDYMVESGKYSASEIAKAFAASTDAQAAALSVSAKDQQDALDAISAKYKTTLDAIDSEMKSLSDSVAQEAPEEFMGVVEAQQRARLADLANQKKAIEAQENAELDAKQSTFDAMLLAGKDVDSQLRQLFGKPLEIPYYYTPQNSPGGGGAGASYVPPVAKPRATGGTSDNVTVPFVVVSHIDGEVVARSAVQYAQRTGNA